MSFPAITAFYAGLFGLLYVVLSLLVVFGRIKFKVNHGDGGVERMQRLIRSHANFIEYVPLILLLSGFLEASGGDPALIRDLLLVVLVARVMHPAGMLVPRLSVQQFLFRGVPTIATWIVLVIIAIKLL